MLKKAAAMLVSFSLLFWERLSASIMDVSPTSVARICGICFSFGAILTEIAGMRDLKLLKLAIDLGLAYLAPHDLNVLEYIGIVMSCIAMFSEFWNLMYTNRPVSRAIGTILAIFATMGIGMLLVRSILSAGALFNYEAAAPEPDFALSRWLRTEEKRRLEERMRKFAVVRVVAATFYGLLYCTLLESLLQRCCKVDMGSSGPKDVIWERKHPKYDAVGKMSTVTESESV